MSSFLQELTEGKIDFAGQQTVDNLAKIVLIASTFVAFVVGFALQDQRATFAVVGITVLGLAFVVLPPWPMFNQHPVKWLPAAKEKK